MRIRQAAAADLDGALAVYESARAFMREAGNPNQWGDGFPPRELVESDIAAGVLRVCAGEADEVLGCFAFIPGPESDYARLYEGAWPSDEPYDVVHRFAALRQGQGVGGAMLDWALGHGRNLRVDTHRDNKPMQGLLASRGLSCCGIIRLGRSGDERLAYARAPRGRQ
ncbi:MAG: N-acetyltransferase [Coriobacteriaceae bacterium]|nr:N-acetyltransferase [Coriobacteriaceae bacterium]MCI6844678.1 N-acetyltransferase [Coriobacteriaceae bacterium]MDD7585014.1 N-acetyltransferase [Coriobacteriaceae bacterium]